MVWVFHTQTYLTLTAGCLWHCQSSCDNRDGGPGSKFGANVKFWKRVLTGILLYALPFWKLSSRISPLLSLILTVGIALHTLVVWGASCGFPSIWQLALLECWNNYTLALGVTGAVGQSCCHLSFSHLKWCWLQVISSLGWVEDSTTVFKVWGRVGDIRDPRFNSGISYFATFHCGRGQDRYVLRGQESCH